MLRPSVPMDVVAMASVLTSSAGVTLAGNMSTAVCASVSTIVSRGATVKMALVYVHLATAATTVPRKYASMTVLAMASAETNSVSATKAFQEKTVL